ncbi:hypothetical protein EDC14_100191 [Hydrogenispora ethanolica]|uniref:Uncharacterized protein n=1 Tax=Hydrogenispora ethanolica TaxID=1082276 RepID=A0A4R1SBL5_HYDET|nr:hypothetical protein EDC14_100191 [Hydrogenispora ethanolica]
MAWPYCTNFGKKNAGNCTGKDCPGQIGSVCDGILDQESKRGNLALLAFS